MAQRLEFRGIAVTDKFSGLVRQLCSVGQSWSLAAKTCTGSATAYPYDEAMALTKAAQVGSAGGSLALALYQTTCLIDRQGLRSPVYC